MPLARVLGRGGRTGLAAGFSGVGMNSQRTFAAGAAGAAGAAWAGATGARAVTATARAGTVQRVLMAHNLVITLEARQGQKVTKPRRVTRG
ncbi:hypothetical protein GCM10009678_87840 [Actinomadura kijaniata]